jgi:hypothetical protein
VLAALFGFLATGPSAAATPTAPERVDLPEGFQPEGITTDGRFLYAGSLADGALVRVSVRTGAIEPLAAGTPGRVAVGVDYDRRRDVIWVAGGPTGEIRAQDADTGEVLATYTFAGAGFVNDLVVTKDAVYATDSVNPELLVVPLEPGRRLPAASAATTLPLSGDLQYTAGFNLNGIVARKDVLYAVQSNTGLLFAIDPATGTTSTVDLDGASLLSGDGLELRKDVLYVVRNRLNRIAVVELEKRSLEGEVVAELTDPDFDVPTTVAFARHSLFAVNARFGTPSPATADYWITRLDAYRR